MTGEHDEALRYLADELAQDLSGSDGTASLLTMQRLGIFAGPERKPPAARPGTVGIWEAAPHGYVRSPALRPEWGLWASVEAIPPKGERPRVLLLGESAARGFLYDPDFNPARSLGDSLAMALDQEIEVVDLAKSDLKVFDLEALAGAVPALDADALVLFAGNNWSVRDPRDGVLEAAVLRKDGVAGLKRLIEWQVAKRFDALRQQFTRLSERLFVVVVVPETNLADWRLDTAADVPWLPGGRHRRWLDHRAAARAALAAGCSEEAERLAHEMVALDGGTASAGWTLLADCAGNRGDWATAHSCLEKARDARTWDNTYQTPRALSVVQQALRGWALPGRIAVVDLPSCFRSWQGGELPGRRLFLDYCHLSSEGIKVAMASAASALADLLQPNRPLPALDRLVQASPPLSDDLEAAAHFGGAIHSAHWGQPYPIVAFHCREAARRSPRIAQAMQIYLEIRARQAPTWTCAAALRLSALATPFLRRYILRFHAKLFEPVLLPAIADALEANGIPSTAFLDQLRREEGSLSERPRDLLDPLHRASLADRDWLEWPAHFCRAYSPTSRYPWVSRTPREVALELTCRQISTAGPGVCRVRINGTCVAELALTPEWRTFRFAAPADLVQAGVNWLEIDWPRELPDGEQELEGIAREREQGRQVPLLPVFAEISSLRAVEEP